MVVASKARVLDFLVGLARVPRKNRPFSGQQHQAQFGLNPALLVRDNVTDKSATKKHETIVADLLYLSLRRTSLRQTNFLSET